MNSVAKFPGVKSIDPKSDVAACLDEAKAEDFDSVVIVGMRDGKINYRYADENLPPEQLEPKALLMMEIAKSALVLDEMNKVAEE